MRVSITEAMRAERDDEPLLADRWLTGLVVWERAEYFAAADRVLEKRGRGDLTLAELGEILDRPEGE